MIKRFTVSLAVTMFIAGSPVGARPSEPVAEEPEFAPIVKTLSGEDLPVALRLSTFVTKTDKALAFDPDLAKKSLLGSGLTVTDADLDLFDSLYGDFDEDLGARHARVLAEHAEEPGKIEEAGERFQLERAAFTGGVLGAWLAHLRDQGQDTDAFLLEVVEAFAVSAFWGGKPPTLEGLEREAKAFEHGFLREYGVPLTRVFQDRRGGACEEGFSVDAGPPRPRLCVLAASGSRSRSRQLQFPGKCSRLREGLRRGRRE